MQTVLYVKEVDDFRVISIKNKMLEFCVANDYYNEKIFVEKDDSRSEFNKMLCYIRENNIECLIIDKIQHLTKNMREMTEMMNCLSEAGIKSIITEDGNILDGYFLNRKFNDEMESFFAETTIYNPLFNTKGKRVAIYHISLDPKRDSCIELQMKVLRSFAKNKKWDIVGEYIDLSCANSKREQLEVLKQNIKQYDIILVKWAYYFTRETSSFLRFRNEMIKEGVRIYSINEGWC